MKYLFYFVHPAKYHLFRYTILKLKEEHNTVDIVINSKGVLEDLLIKEGWKYKNIFPKGRNISSKPSIIKSGLKFLLTLFRLEIYLWENGKYDIFITDDALVVNGWFRHIPSYIFNDNDIETIRINKILFYFATMIICPTSTFLGPFENKKISFKGNKALAHLHPKYFSPDEKTIIKYGFIKYKYIIVRLAILNATHDANKNIGIQENDINKLIEISGDKFKIIILNERKIKAEYSKFYYPGQPNEIFDFFAYAKLVISDSGTMATEASVLGTPNILINKLAKYIGVHKELKNAGLQLFFDCFDEALLIICEFINEDQSVINWNERKEKYLSRCDDPNEIFINLFKEFYEK
ncbi:MAG TPA: DUF354 domain-containing protein [Ignavibacteriaceae bacterium]|jgi:predicted glycosyltransferase|nr:MAG: hypothetical protein BroJett005_23940 [Ignavibacteriota bacterium]HMN15985.1 DUF354 domain-containing protein [Ignavibacteriaceae bacterium]